MFRTRSLWLASLAALLLAASAAAQPTTGLRTATVRDTLDSNGDAVTLTGTGGLAGLAIQTLDSYSGTWELQCSTDAGTTYDTDDEVLMTLVGGTSQVAAVTDTVGIWQANISGCNAVRVVATAGFAASDTVVQMQAITPGGGSGGGGGGTFDGVLLDAAGGDAMTTTALNALKVDIVGIAGVAPVAAICDNPSLITTAVINTASSGNVQIVALDGADLIYVCGYSVVAGAATGVQLIYGTGAACATGETDITGVWSFAANGGIALANAGFPQHVVPTGNALCVENSGANSIQGHITYVQQP
jgi:hypothetical protein